MAAVTVYCLCGKPYDPSKFMIQCDACKDWFHGSCVGLHEQRSSEIEKYHCPKCEKMFGPSISKSRTNWHRHNATEEDADKKAVQTGTPVFIKELKSRHFPSADAILRVMRGQQLSLPFLIQNGFDEPILVDNMDGLGLVVPPSTFVVEDLEKYFGPDFEIDAIDVSRQEDIRMTLHDFVQYFNSPSRSKVLNMISLEFSNSSMTSLVEPPFIVNKLSWVHNLWPDTLPEDCHFTKPNVHKYCLIGVRDSFTDFHIDFGGTSVWYHVLKGEKVFFLIRPTPANLALYRRWMASTNRSETFFGDQVDACYRCILRQGHTLLIPTGWIHAVLTPTDSLVFGGNFLHSLHIPLQLQVYDIERHVKTPEKYRFPFFETCNWFAAKHLLSEFKDHCGTGGKPLPYLVQGAKALVSALKGWTQEKEYLKMHKEEIPSTIQFAKLIRDLAKEVRQAEKVPPSKKSKLRLLPPRDKRGRMAIRLGSGPNDDCMLSHSKDANSDSKGLTVPLDDLTAPSLKVKLHVSKPSALLAEESLLGQKFKSKATVRRKVSNPAENTRMAIKKDSSRKKADASVYDFCESDDDALIVDECPTKSSKRRSGMTVDFRRQQLPIKLKLSIAGKPSTANLPSGTPTPSSTELVNQDSQIPPTSPKLAGIEELLRASRYSAEDSAKSPASSQQLPRSHVTKQIRVTEEKKPEEMALLNLDVVDSDDTYAVSPSGRASPSTCEAIQGMLSIGQDVQFIPAVAVPSLSQSYPLDTTTSAVADAGQTQMERHLYLTEPTASEPFSKRGMTSPKNKSGTKRKGFSTFSLSDDDKILIGCHEDEEFVYPSLDASDDDVPVFKSRRRDTLDESWNPKARLVPNCPKPERPVREGVKNEAIECGLAAAAAKLAHLPAPKRKYNKKKSTKIKKILCHEPETEPSTSADISMFPTNAAFPRSNFMASLKVKKSKRGFATTKQRLGRILKIHKMLY